MGAKIPSDTPLLPGSIAYIWELHKSVRFSLILADDKYSLMPREPINARELECYLGQAGLELNRVEFDAILAIDATYEKYRG